MNTRYSLLRPLRVLLVLGLGACVVAIVVPFSLGEAADPGAAPGAAPAPPAAAPLTELQVVEKVTKATDRALDYLERIQVKEGTEAGSWSSGFQAINAMAMLAFMSKGHVPGRGKYGDVRARGIETPGVLTRAKKYMLSKAQPTGYLAIGGQMYDHGMATLALAEMYGMDPDPDGKLEAKLRKAVDLILRSQGPVGGWNYQW
jgi:hypothetical protein